MHKRLINKQHLFFALLLIFTLMIRLYNISSPNVVHPDEIIPVKVVERMYQTGDWDNNWAKADLPQSFKYDQYNFSAYINTSFVFYSIVQVFSTLDPKDYLSNIHILRYFSAILGALGGVFVILIANTLWGQRVAFISLFLYAVAPILVQDSHYARPDTFCTFLVLFVVFLMVKSNEDFSLRQAFFSSFLIGLLIATKVTMIFVSISLVYMVFKEWEKRNFEIKSLGQYIIISFFGLFIGLIIGMPYAVVNINAYLHGIHMLSTQYSGKHPPHSPFNNDFLFNFRMPILYISQTLGIISIIAFILATYNAILKRDYTIIFIFSMPVVFFYVYYGFQSVFFERNFSHLVPIFLILSSVGMVELTKIARNLKMRIIVMLVLVTLAVVPPLNIDYNILVYEWNDNSKEELARYEKELQNQYQASSIISTGLLSPNDIDKLKERISEKKVIIRVDDYNDSFTGNYLPQLIQRYDLVQITPKRGTFKNIVTSTLHAYISQNHTYYLYQFK